MEPGIAVPEGVGPHEGRECAMMLAGAKPLAMFCEVASHADYFPEHEFAPHVVAGRLFRREELYFNPESSITFLCVFFALPGHQWRMEAAHMIKKAILTGERRGMDADDVQLGRLLGYAEGEIAIFLDHARRCRHFLMQSAQMVGENTSPCFAPQTTHV